MAFATVTGDVVELPFSSHPLCYELPVSIADGAIALVLKEDGGFSTKGLSFKKRAKGNSLEGDFTARVVAFCEVEAGGHDVNQVRRIFHPDVLLSDTEWPVGDEGGRDATFMDPVLILTEGGVGDVCPVLAIGDVGLWRTRDDSGALPRGEATAGFLGNHIMLEFIRAHRGERGFYRADEGADALAAAEVLGAGSVILEEEDEGVIELFIFFEGLNDAAYALVHIINHGGVDFHAGCFPLFKGDFRPVSCGGGNFPGGVDEAKSFHFFNTGAVDGAVSLVVVAFILGDVFRKGVHGPVSCGVGDVLEEGFLRVLF